MTGPRIDNPKSWLFRCTKNACLNIIRHSSSSETELFDTNAAPIDLEEEAIRRQEFRMMLIDIANLPESQKKALLASTMHDRSMREIGNNMGLTEGAVRMLLHRARTELRTRPFSVDTLDE